MKSLAEKIGNLLLDCCASTFGFGRKTHHRITSELPTTTEPTTNEMETSSTTTETLAINTMTEMPEASTDSLSLKERYDHFAECDEVFRDVYCLNGGSCFVHFYDLEGQSTKIMHCECVSHFIGDRCEFKALEGSYGGGRVLSKTKRSIRRSNNIEPPKDSRMFKSL
jgi:hypothetical protein